MKSPPKVISFLASVALLVTIKLSAATTVPVGYVTVEIPEGSIGSPSVTVLSLPLYQTASITGSNSGTISSSSSNTITVTSAGWSAGELAADGEPYFLRIKSGNYSGSLFLISANTSDTLTLDTEGIDLSSISGSANTFEIVPGNTILSAFGTPNDGVVGSTSATEADLIYILDGSWKKFYFNTANSRWEQPGLEFLGDQGNVVLPPNKSFIYARVGGQYDLVTSGTVPVDQVQTSTNTGANTMVATNLPVDTRLDSLGVENMPSWRAVGDSGVTAADADLVYILDGSWKKYYYNRTTGEWLQPELEFLGDQSSTAISAGSGFLLGRFGSSGSEVLTQTVDYLDN